jgi:hypothetical protein
VVIGAVGMVASTENGGGRDPVSENGGGQDPVSDTGGAASQETEDSVQRPEWSLRSRMRKPNRRDMPTSTPRSSLAVNKYLLPREVPVATVRKHPGALVVSMADAVGAVAIAVALTGTVAHSSSFNLVIWVPTAFLGAQFLWTAIGWPVNYFVVTNERVLLLSGFFPRKVRMIPLGQLVSMTYERSFAGRLLGFGKFIDASGGRDRVIFEHVPYPEQLYLLICGMLFPAGVDEDDDDHGHRGDDWPEDHAAI